MYDVTIIGGGVIGSAIARELMRYDVRAILVDKEIEVGFGASKSNSGIIHAGHHSTPGTRMSEFEWTGNQMWDELAEELGFAFRRIGELMLALEPDQVETLHEHKRQGEERGVTGLEIWDRERILKEEPAVVPTVEAALYAPTAGVINPYEACFALVGNAEKNGLELSLDNAVVDLQQTEDGWNVVTKNGIIATRYIINASGLFADQVAAMAGDDSLKINPRKGEEYILDKRLEGFVKRLLFPCPTPTSKGILVIPTYDGTLMVGPTAHPTPDKEDLTTTAIGSEEVFSFVRGMVPGISERDCIAQFAGLRAAEQNHDFVIAPSSAPQMINVAGIQSPGLTAAPAIAVEVMRLLQQVGLKLTEKDDFDPTYEAPVRFNSLPRETQRRLIEENPGYGRIVCRCEHVTEGEIRDAIKAGARTLDGLKFRTRAGMGRCQGGFCTWRCMELLAEDQQVPLEEISKRGGDSWLVCAFEGRDDA